MTTSRFKPSSDTCRCASPGDRLRQRQFPLQAPPQSVRGGRHRQFATGRSERENGSAASSASATVKRRDGGLDERQVSTTCLDPHTLPKPSGYSQVVAVSGGRTVYISGQVPPDASNELVGDGDFASQARQVFENLRLALESAGLTFAHVVKLQYYVTDIAYLQQLRAVRDGYIDPRRPPASTLVEVSTLFQPDILVEVDAIAVG